MTKKIYLLFLLVFMVGLLPLPALTIKMGSLFPEGTEWDRTLKRIARDWKEITDGRVILKIYPGGIAGTEEDMVRKMRIGQLDAAVMTIVGMNKIVSDSLVFSLPFLIHNDQELDFILEEITPMLTDDFQEKGFEPLLWSKSGWINLFSNREIYVPDDARKTKMGVDTGEQDMIEAFKALRFNVVPLSMNDTLMGLQSGMIDTVYTAPMGAAAYQWFALARNMNPLEVMPVVGGVVISDRAWSKIPRQYHEALKQSMEEAGREFYTEAEKLNEQAMDVMRQNGLNELTLTDSQVAQWHEMFAGGYGFIVGPGKPVSREIFDEVNRRLEEFRAGQ